MNAIAMLHQSLPTPGKSTATIKPSSLPYRFIIDIKAIVEFAVIQPKDTNSWEMKIEFSEVQTVFYFCCSHFCHIPISIDFAQIISGPNTNKVGTKSCVR
jgi:hypothetical protein